MVNPPERIAIARWMPALLVGGLGAVLVAAVLIVLAGRAEDADRGYRGHLAELTVLAGSMPAQAAAAARGDAAAFDRLAASRTTLERVLTEIDEGRSPFAALSSESARRLGGQPAWNTLLDSSQQVLAARSVAGDLGKAAADSRAILGRVLAATGNTVSAPGGLTAMRVLPRFETVAQRTSDDLEQLGSAVNPAEVSRRITENSALLAQFLAGLAGTGYDRRRAGGPGRGSNPARRGADCVRLRTRSSSRERSSRRPRSRAPSAPRRTSAARPTSCRSCSRHRRRPSRTIPAAPLPPSSRLRWRCCASPPRSGAGLRKPACAASRASSRSATVATRMRSCGCSTKCRASPTAT